MDLDASAKPSRIDQASNGVIARKLENALPHWLRHTHATMALQGSADLLSVRDNLRYASVTTTSNYLHTEDKRRASQLGRVFKKTTGQ
jgi:site-specific recombinase XerD